MSNAIRCIDERFAFKNSGISFLALIFNLSNLRTTILHSKNQFQNGRYEKLYTVFFLLNDSNLSQYGSVIITDEGESVDLATWVWVLQVAETLCHCHFEWHWACHCTDTFSFILLISVISLSLSLCIFLSWISSAAIWCWQSCKS